MTRFKRHRLEWFSHRVGQIIRWEVPACGKLSAVEKLPSCLMIVDERHAKALHDFQNNNKINFYETEVKATA